MRIVLRPQSALRILPIIRSSNVSVLALCLHRYAVPLCLLVRPCHYVCSLTTSTRCRRDPSLDQCTTNYNNCMSNAPSDSYAGATCGACLANGGSCTATPPCDLDEFGVGDGPTGGTCLECWQFAGYDGSSERGWVGWQREDSTKACFGDNSCTPGSASCTCTKQEADGIVAARQAQQLAGTQGPAWLEATPFSTLADGCSGCLLEYFYNENTGSGEVMDQCLVNQTPCTTLQIVNAWTDGNDYVTSDSLSKCVDCLINDNGWVPDGQTVPTRACGPDTLCTPGAADCICSAADLQDDTTTPSDPCVECVAASLYSDKTRACALTDCGFVDEDACRPPPAPPSDTSGAARSRVSWSLATSALLAMSIALANQ